MLRRWAPDIPVTTNFMRLYYGLDYHKMADKLDIISWDSYPAWGNTDESEEQMFLHTAFEHAFMRSMKRDRPFLLMESTPNLVNWHPFNKAKRPGMHKLTSLHAVACGSDSVLYFQWRKGRGSYEQFHGAVIDHLGTNDTRVFADVKEVGEILDSLEAVRGSVVKSQVAIIFDWENRWAIDDMAGLSGNKNYVETVRQVYEILLTHGIDADLLPADSDFIGYKAVIAPMLYMIKENTAKNLERFTAGGGQLLGTYLTGYVNENTLCWLGGFPGDGLRKLFGLYSEEIDTLYPEEKNSMCFEGKTFKLTDFCEILKTETAQVMGVYGDDFYAGSPVFTKNPWKMGCAWYIGARADTDGMTGILRQVCAAAGLEFEALPRGLMIHRRYKGEDKYIFYVNTAKEKISYHGKEIGPMRLLLYKEENGVGTWLDLC